MTEKPTLLTPRQVAERLGRAGRTVRNWIRDGRLKAKRDLASGSLYLEVAEVERFERELGDYAATREKARRPPNPPDPAPAPAPGNPDPAGTVPPSPRRKFTLLG